MTKSEDKGGRLPANFRSANIAEGIAMQMLRPFAAIAPVPREEDHGIDVIATLLRKDSSSLLAEDSFLIQIKTHTAARFEFQGDGIRWLRQLQLPYFPLVVNFAEATASLFTLNEWHMPIHTSRVDRFVFCTEGDEPDDFPLAEPLMQWSLADCVHPEFGAWAYSVLKPAVRIERSNQRYGPMSQFFVLAGGPYRFSDRNSEGFAVSPPHVEATRQIGPGDREAILEAVQHAIRPFANLVSNHPWADDRGDDLLQLRDILRRLGVDPDPDSQWEAMAADMSNSVR